MNDFICKHNDCTGCEACASICPKECIDMKQDQEGFFRPVIKIEQCINCGMCKRICPINNCNEDDGKYPKAFAAKSKDEQIRNLSSSGGVFSALAKYILDNNGAVIGAAFDKHFNVIHKVCTNNETIDELRRSKYVQSRIGTVYKEAKLLLDDGKKVLFCGTPCQIGGIKSFLGKDYSNLYLVDFICHGVPSPLAWKKYLKFRKEKEKSEIKKINFRCKDTGWKNYSLEIVYENEAKYSEKVSNDSFLRTFVMDMNLRSSCYNCKFKQIHRISDITLADFWGYEKNNNQWNDDKGISLVMTHTDKANDILYNIQEEINLYEVSFKDAISNNPSMIKSSNEPPLRDAFFKNLENISYLKLQNKYCGDGLFSKIRRKIAYYIRNGKKNDRNRK